MLPESFSTALTKKVSLLLVYSLYVTFKRRSRLKSLVAYIARESANGIVNSGFMFL